MKLADKTNEEIEMELKSLVTTSHNIEVTILLYLREVTIRNIDNAQYLSLASYCQHILGLTKSQSLKRSQAATTANIAPETIDMLKNGETHVSQMALLAPKLTEANKDKILKFLPGASKRDLEFFLQSIDRAGNITIPKPKIDLTIRCSQELFEDITRLQGLLAQSRGANDKTAVIEKAVKALLDIEDPKRKEERREKRKAKKKGNENSAKKEIQKVDKTKTRSRYIPEDLKAAVYKRDGYRCTFHDYDQKRCEEDAMLQVDHCKPWSLGGEHTLDNLTILCPRHNKVMSRRILGDSADAWKQKSPAHTPVADNLEKKFSVLPREIMDPLNDFNNKKSAVMARQGYGGASSVADPPAWRN